jgi:hypothetical protein
MAHDTITGRLRHVAYAAGWKKFEPLWDVVIRARRAGMMLPALEAILSEFGRRRVGRHDVHSGGATEAMPKHSATVERNIDGMRKKYTIDSTNISAPQTAKARATPRMSVPS